MHQPNLSMLQHQPPVASLSHIPQPPHPPLCASSRHSSSARLAAWMTAFSKPLSRRNSCKEDGAQQGRLALMGAAHPHACPASKRWVQQQQWELEKWQQLATKKRG